MNELIISVEKVAAASLMINHSQFDLRLHNAMDNLFRKKYCLEPNWFQFDSVLHNQQSPSQAPWSLPLNVSTPLRLPELPSCPVDRFAEEDRSTSASKSHSQAEKRRRDRINAQLAALRKLIPKSDKMDKAALLGSAIEHIKDLKREASEVSKGFIVPTEVDEVAVDCDVAEASAPTDFGKGSNNMFIRASLCCDDRPELFKELIGVFRRLKVTIVRADICSVGGRIKSILVLRSKDGEEGVCISTLKQSLKAVISRILSLSMATNRHIRSKRQRFFFPSHYSQ